MVQFITLKHFNATGIYFNVESWLAQPAVYLISIPIATAGLFLTLKK
jgi:hypothetical protein